MPREGVSWMSGPLIKWKHKYVHLRLMKRILFISLSLFMFLSAGFSQTIQDLEKRLAKATSNQELIKLHRDIGAIYYNEGDFTSALNHFFKALSAAEQEHDRFRIATSNQAIGSVYMETEKFDEAIVYLKKAEQALSELKEYESLGRTLITLGNVYYLQFKDSISEDYYLQALNHFRTIDDSTGLMDAYKNLGALYFEKGSRSDTLKGLTLIRKSLDYVRWSDTLNKFQSTLSMAELYTYSGNLPAARTYLELCASFLPRIKALHIIDDYYYCWHDYHKKKGDFEQALSSYKSYKVYQDSILNVEKSKQLSELNVKYGTRQKEEQIRLLNAQRKAQQLTLLVVIMLVAFLAVLSSFLFLRYRNRQKIRKRQELQKHKEAERMRIARDMHDEIGSGLTRILMRSQQVKLQLRSGKELKNGVVESLEKIAGESRELSHNIGEIIWSLNPKNDTLDNLLAYLRSYAYDYLEEADIICSFKFPDNIPDIPVSPEQRRNIFLIVKESLNNIVKHASATRVEIEVQILNNHFSVNIRDDGKGLPVNGLRKQGNGLGNMEKRVTECGGNFSIESANGKGLCVSIENIPY